MTDDPLQPARDEVFRKLGRNIASFQQLERALKDLIAQSQIEGSSSEEIEAHARKRRGSVETKMLGMLSRRYSKEVLTEIPDDDEAESTTNKGVRFIYISR